jgi:hypothetical protein
VTPDPLVEELARLDKDRRREIVEAAHRERQRLIGDVIKQVRAALLPGFNERRASRAIEDAARGRRASFRDNPALRMTIERQLRRGLGSLDDVPGFERIRQLLRE